MEGRPIRLGMLAAALLVAAFLWQVAYAQAPSAGQGKDEEVFEPNPAFGPPTGRAPGPTEAPEDLGALVERYHRLEYVVISPEGPSDGGDFGPKTPGTKTSGFQEALNYAKAHGRDVYVVGGGMKYAIGGATRYWLDETLIVPWMEDFRMDGGEYFLIYGKTSGDAIVFDSQMNCRYKLGLVISSSKDGAAVALRPMTRGVDHFSCITVCYFDFSAIIGGTVGLLFDGTYGYIHLNKIFTPEVAGSGIGILVGKNSFNNWISCPFMHRSRIHLQVGDAGISEIGHNRIEAYITGQGDVGSVGARIFGQRDLYSLTVARAAEGKGIILEDSARDNLIYALHLDGGLTNNAVVPTNRIITLWPIGFDVPTPPFPASGEDVVNRNPYPAEILIKAPGEVTDWTLTDASGVSERFVGELTPGLRFILQPGEKIRFTYSTAPTWRWKASQ